MEDYTSSTIPWYEHKKEIKSVILENGVTSVGSWAFYSCNNLTSATIPDSVDSIGKWTFSYCTSLTDIYFNGTEEWNAILIGSDNEYLTNATIHYNYSEVSAEILSATSTPISITTLSQANITGEPFINTFGTVFISLALYADKFAKTAKVEYDNSLYNIKDGQKFEATLANIPESCKDMSIVAMSFIQYNNGDFAYSDAKYMSVNDTTLNNVE